jgi:cyanophycinase
MLMALLGSGEFEPWTEQVDRWLLERATGDGTVLILPTASAPEGDDVFDRWGTMGKEHYADVGVPSRVVPLKTRADAAEQKLIDALDGASVTFFSGGNPAYLAATLRQTPFWAALLRSMDRGLAYAGCSAGVACLGEVAPDSSIDPTDGDLWRPGLGLAKGTYFGPHWDMLERSMPGLQSLIVSAVPEGSRLFAIDERTAAVGDGTTWTVMGAAGIHLLDHGQWSDHSAGETIEVILVPATAEP